MIELEKARTQYLDKNPCKLCGEKSESILYGVHYCKNCTPIKESEARSNALKYYEPITIPRI